MTSHRAFLVLAALVLLTLGPSFVLARRPGGAVQCRNHIGSAVRELTRTGLRVLDTCDQRPRVSETCGNLAARPSFTRALARARGILDQYWCTKETTILQNYPSPMGTVMAVVGPFVQKALEKSAQAIAPVPIAAEQIASRRVRQCRRTIREVRTALVNAVLAESVRCQRAIDRRNTEFGAIAPECLVDAPRTALRAARRLSRACAGISGSAVGSCDPLPDCVVASATETGHTIATTAYGFGAGQVGLLCGNGEVDPGESCDEGSANSPTGACTDTCQIATCGDGKVEAGVEDCDNGKDSNGRNFDSATCTAACKAVHCGDGRLDPGEECDDGNTAAGDGCSPGCKFEPVPCPAGGTLDVTVTLVPTRDTYSSNYVAGLEIDIGYSASLSIPGSEFLDVSDPADPAATIVLLRNDPAGINLYDGLVTFYDADASPPTTLKTILGLNATANLIFSESVPFERIRFACPADAQVTENDVPCTIVNITNLLASPIPPEQYPRCQVTLPRSMIATTSTTTTSTTATSRLPTTTTSTTTTQPSTTSTTSTPTTVPITTSTTVTVVSTTTTT